MLNSTLISTIKAIPSGRFFRMTYKTELPVKAEHKKAGVTIIKITSSTVRTGVSYNSIAVIKAYKSANAPSDKVKTNNYVWVEKNRIKHNTSTGKDYFVIATHKNSHPKSYFIVRDSEGERIVSETELNKSLVRDSYWNSGSSFPSVVKTISLENIISIGE